MRTIELKRVWPDHAATHDISDTELRRIASTSPDIDAAKWTWKNELWWQDDLSNDIGHLKIEDVNEAFEQCRAASAPVSDELDAALDPCLEWKPGTAVRLHSVVDVVTGLNATLRQEFFEALSHVLYPED